MEESDPVQLPVFKILRFHLCFRQRVQCSSLFALYKSSEIISFFFSDNFFRNTKKRAKDLFYFFKKKISTGTLSCMSCYFPMCRAFFTEGPHWVRLRHQAHNSAVLGFGHAAVELLHGKLL